MAKIGLEIHSYISTDKKLFCNCNAEHNKKFVKPNTNICPICTGQPGAKPLKPNEMAIVNSIKISEILGCKINSDITWQRKHYSWPDLPKGYQNTISGPHAKTNGVDGKFEGITILECHLEEDPAAWNPETGEIDYNRSGYPLIEIVTAPEFTSPEEVETWLKKLRSILSYMKTIDPRLGLKADVNVSLPEKNGERVEVKNVNSIQNIKKTIEIEIERQKKEVPKIQETRRFEEKSGTTTLMRTKEQAQDYRFVVDPDLPKIILSKKFVEDVKKSLPKRPSEKMKEILRNHSLDKKDVEVLLKNVELIDLFEEVSKKVDSKKAARWIIVQLLGTLNHNKIELSGAEVNPAHLINLILAVENNKITEGKAKKIIQEWTPESSDPKKEIEKNSKIIDEKIINVWVKEAIAENEKAVSDYHSGNSGAINFLLGKVVQKSERRADIDIARKLLEKNLK